MPFASRRRVTLVRLGPIAPSGTALSLLPEHTVVYRREEIIPLLEPGKPLGADRVRAEHVVDAAEIGDRLLDLPAREARRLARPHEQRPIRAHGEKDFARRLIENALPQARFVGEALGELRHAVD